MTIEGRVEPELAGHRARAGWKGRERRGYRAHDGRLDRDVALKVLPAYASDLEFRRSLIRESMLAASLDHPNVVPVHDAGGLGRACLRRDAFVAGTVAVSLVTAPR